MAQLCTERSLESKNWSNFRDCTWCADTNGSITEKIDIVIGNLLFVFNRTLTNKGPFIV